MKDSGRAVSTKKKKKRWLNMAHKPVGYLRRAVPVGHVSGSCQWVVIMDSYFFKKNINF